MARKSKRIRKIIKKRHLSDAALLDLSYEWITQFQNAFHTPIEIYDGISRKVRHIIVPTLEELIVQHCVVNALRPIFTKGMYLHTYASIPGRGPHKAKKFIEKWLRDDPKNTKYVLKWTSVISSMRFRMIFSKANWQKSSMMRRCCICSIRLSMLLIRGYHWGSIHLSGSQIGTCRNSITLSKRSFMRSTMFVTWTTW